MAKKTAQELAADIPDPSDFVQPELARLDSALRCNICREIYDAPVSITCGHCFCSMCVRQSMSTKAECPVCRKHANESHIRPIVALDEAVEAWQSARGIVLQVLKDADQSNHGKRHRSSESDDVEIMAGPSKRKKKSSSDQFVECPVCCDLVKDDAINQHLDDGCKTSTSSPPSVEDREKQKNEWSRLMGGKKEKVKERVIEDDEGRLPKVSYHITREKQLREMLTQYELSTTGDKNTLIARHQQWSRLWNANQDRLVKHRHPVDQLRKDLKKWEDLGKGKKVVIEDTQEYEKIHRDEFGKLIERARPKRPLSQAPQQDNADADAKGEDGPQSSLNSEGPNDVIEIA